MGHQYDANFFQLGRFENVRLVGNKILADLIVYNAADLSPALDNMATWFLALASEDPQAVMISASCKFGKFYQYDEKNRKVYVPGGWWGIEKAYPDKPVYMEFVRVYSADVVDEGALTSSLFSAGAQDAASLFHHCVNDPEFAEWFEANESRFPFFKKYYAAQERGWFNQLFTSLIPNSKKVEQEKTAVPAAPITSETTQPTAELCTIPVDDRCCCEAIE